MDNLDGIAFNEDNYLGDQDDCGERTQETGNKFVRRRMALRATYRLIRETDDDEMMALVNELDDLMAFFDAAVEDGIVEAAAIARSYRQNQDGIYNDRELLSTDPV